MKLTNDQILKNIVLNENAYFYRNVDEIELTKDKINKIFESAAKDKLGRYLLKVINEKYKVKGITIEYSMVVFKYQTIPSLIEEPLENWEEIKIGYLLIINFSDYVVMVKRNISNIKKYIDEFETIDYSTISTLFIKDETQIEKLALLNLNISDKAMRTKTVEANDLKQNFSSLGASNYVVNNLRVKNEEEKTSLSLNTSRINKFGKKNSIVEVIEWSKNQVDKIKSHKNSETFLSIFAESIDYKSAKHTLIPIAILFIFSKLHDDFENNYLQDARYYLDKETYKSIDLISNLSKLNTLCQITSINDDVEIRFYVENQIASDLEIKFYENSIGLKSEKLRKIQLVKQNGKFVKLIDYINSSSQFLINFDNVDLAYSNKKLFKDSRLMGSIENFLKVFNTYPELSKVTSEKGSFTTKSTEFSKKSLFNFVEKKFIDEVDFLVCDDLSKEWADHIGINDKKIIFYHSKYKETSFSASAFQDIVGQAQKNLGNFNPQPYQLLSKLEFWKKDYNAMNSKTKIKRLRKGSNIDDFVTKFRNTQLNPATSREVNIVLNFISKSELEDRLKKLRDGEYFKERNEVIQILWFISSYVSSSLETGVIPYISCKP